MQTRDWLFIAVLIWGGWHSLGGALPALPNIIAPAEATAATYVYEKDDTAPPDAVKFALNRLNREKNVVATVFDDDTVDGTGETPEQYKLALAEAKKVGLPALVVTGPSGVIKVVPKPTTEQAVWEAVP